MNNTNSQILNQLINKVPQITLWFWFMKIMSTTIGETEADFLIFNLGFGLPMTILIAFPILCIFLFLQFNSKTFSAAYYWGSIILISVFGTLVTDFLTDIAKIDLAVTSTVFTIMLLGIFVFWLKKEKTISIHEINTPMREAFYWAAIFATFALGTAVGDWFSESLNIGYLYSAMLFAGTIAVIYAAYSLKIIDATISFWMAYILTRPFGASLGDYLTQPASNGGLGINTAEVSAYFGGILLVSILYSEIAKYIANARNRKIIKPDANSNSEK